ncbi:MAG: NAD regulator [Hyphomicrobiaceae bacterium]|nr:NAD regulator [Hyphomicrobiaceae bacterium]
MNEDSPAPVLIELTASVVTLVEETPMILAISGPDGDALPSGPFRPRRHRTLALGLKSWVSEQTGLDLGYVEQLYTFGDRGRHAHPGDTDPHIVSIGYLALARHEDILDIPAGGTLWRSWYGFFPWEDWREGRPAILDAYLLPALGSWLADPSEPEPPGPDLTRLERFNLAFGEGGSPWDEDKVLDRYELLYEAGLVEEARRDGRPAALRRVSLPPLGRAMFADHRRVLATAIQRLRGKIRYRPVVFELLAEEFTLGRLQASVEAILGRSLHKQNFRRLVDNTQLVEATGAMHSGGPGRPAALFRFRRSVLQERPAPGLRLGRSGIRDPRG